MLIITYFQWWYSAGWSHVAHSWQSRLSRLYLDFSVPLLATTLFAPWRRIATNGSGSLSLRLRAKVDNTVSRFVGLTVRLAVLLAAVDLITAGSVFAAVSLIIWPILPVAALGLITWGIIG
jgi:hypothetical protein